MTHCLAFLGSKVLVAFRLVGGSQRLHLRNFLSCLRPHATSASQARHADKLCIFFICVILVWSQRLRGLNEIQHDTHLGVETRLFFAP
eukprot:SAG11_NODE_2825_length_2937_cov_89.577519_4_plen_88_part_00